MTKNMTAEQLGAFIEKVQDLAGDAANIERRFDRASVDDIPMASIVSHAAALNSAIRSLAQVNVRLIHEMNMAAMRSDIAAKLRAEALTPSTHDR